ncbi:MAG: sirohydrochlorin chelatase [Pirellula sp.]|nr:sirohydrochlorin chelatase [Pirellula sp.]
MSSKRSAAQVPFNTTQAAERRIGVLLVGHGTRDSAGVAEFLKLATLLQARLAPLPVRPGFLELAEPGIDAAVASLAGDGVQTLYTVPVLLFAAGHAKRDIPDAVAAAAARFGLSVAGQALHLGCRPELLALSRRRFDEAVAGRQFKLAETGHVMVGRGSTDDTATAEMREFSAHRAANGAAFQTLTAFAAMAEPRIEPTLELSAASGARHIVVQPHLLFAGELLDRVGSLTAEAARRHPDITWSITRHLGPEPELVECLAASLAETCEF